MSPCPNCSSDRLVARRVHRRGPLAVFFGYALLLPSLLVGVLGTMGVVAPRAKGGAEVTRSALEAAGIPERVAEEVFTRQEVVETELASLAEAQRRLVREAQMALADSGARDTLERVTGGNGFRALVVAAVTGGLLGLFLLRKERVAQCSSCGAFAPGRAAS